MCLRVNLFQVGCSEQSNKTHNFRKIIFCDVIALELNCKDFYWIQFFYELLKAKVQHVKYTCSFCIELTFDPTTSVIFKAVVLSLPPVFQSWKKLNS